MRHGDRIFVSLSADGSQFIIDQRRKWGDTYVPTESYNQSWQQSLPGFRILRDQSRVCDATDAAVEALFKHKEFLELEEDAQLLCEYLLTLSKVADQNALIISDFKKNAQLPQHDFDIGQLSPYQVPGLICSMRTPGFGYFMKQGTGKTPVAIMTICNDADRVKGKYRAIVVCPNNVRLNWQKEFKKFATKPVRTTILRGGQVKRLTQVIEAIRCEEDISVIICSYGTLQQSWEALSAIKFNYGILDEAQRIKSANTKTFAFAVKLRDICARRLVLTGTPIANSIMDLYTLFEFMGQGISGFRTFEGFRKHFGVYRQGQRGDVLEAAQNIPLIKERLARYSYIVTKEEAMPYLPDKTYDTIGVDMTPEQEEAYSRLRDDLIIEIDNAISSSDNEAVTVNNVLTQLLRLSQITSGFKVIPAQHDVDGALISPRQVIKFKENPKVDAILELAKEKGPNDKTIIWSNYVEDIHAINEALLSIGEKPVTFYGKTSYEERIEAERRFNHDPDCRWFIGNPSAGGTGLNLLGYPPGDESYATNCNHVVYFAQNWSSLDREQSEDRAHRRGTREPVRITELQVPNSIDVVIATRVMEKRINAMEVLDLREIHSILQSLKADL